MAGQEPITAFRLPLRAYALSAIRFSQDGEQHTFVHLLTWRGVPGHIKEAGIRGCGAVFQHIVPSLIVVAHHAHMIRHDIQDLPHSMGL